MKSLFSPRVSQHLSSLESSLPHALLLTGPRGVGKTTIAKELARKHLHTIVEPMSTKGEVDHEKGSIKVEQIRSLYTRTAAKTAGTKVILIDAADTMSHAAQNAFLKILEEPPTDTSFILTAEQPSLLLATIHSRVQTLALPLLTNSQSETYLRTKKVTDPTLVRQLLFVAGGRPALLEYYRQNPKKLADNGTLLRDAQTLIRGSFDDRMRMISAYGSSRVDSLRLVDAAKTILLNTLSTQTSPDIVKTLDRLSMTHERLNANANVRLQLLAFVV